MTLSASGVLSVGVAAAERGLVPDRVLRAAIRRLCRQRLRSFHRGEACRCDEQAAFIESLRHGPVALATREANEQHYELPPEFFALVLGARRKYSCCYWPEGVDTLDEAEEQALHVVAERAGLADGQQVLDLGCGWGAFSLWAAERYPGSTFLAVSNSNRQRQYIAAAAAERGLNNVWSMTADINEFSPPRDAGVAGKFDRVISIEMFEHLHNYKLALARLASWLRPEGKAFLHVFCHRSAAYPFESEGSANWMGRRFFSGGIMPSADLIPSFDDDLQVVERWHWNGEHYRRTAEAWLANLDARRRKALSVLAGAYGRRAAGVRLQCWRMFFLAVAELFGFDAGREWFVSHYLLEPIRQSANG